MFSIWCGWDRAEPFKISENVYESDIWGWEHIVNVITGYLEYNMDLGNMNT
jgi:hypothetical protein